MNIGISVICEVRSTGQNEFIIQNCQFSYNFNLMALLYIAVSSSFGLSNSTVYIKTVLFHITLTMQVLAILYDILKCQAVRLLAIVNFTATTN